MRFFDAVSGEPLRQVGRDRCGCRDRARRRAERRPLRDRWPTHLRDACRARDAGRSGRSRERPDPLRHDQSLRERRPVELYGRNRRRPLRHEVRLDLDDLVPQRLSQRPDERVHRPGARLARIKKLDFNAIWITSPVVNQVSQSDSGSYHATGTRLHARRLASQLEPGLRRLRRARTASRCSDHRHRLNQSRSCSRSTLARRSHRPPPRRHNKANDLRATSAARRSRASAPRRCRTHLSLSGGRRRRSGGSTTARLARRQHRLRLVRPDVLLQVHSTGRRPLHREAERRARPRRDLCPRIAKYKLDTFRVARAPRQPHLPLGCRSLAAARAAGVPDSSLRRVR